MIELYDFQVGTTHYRFTNFKSDYTYLDFKYTKTWLKRSKIGISGKENKDKLEIKMDLLNLLMQEYMSGGIEEKVSLTIMRSENYSTFSTIFKGLVGGYQLENTTATLRVDPWKIKNQVVSLALEYGLNCPYQVFGGMCRANKENFKLTTTVSAKSGLTLQSADFAAQPDDYYNAGYVRVVKNGMERMITDHTTNTITLMSGVNALEIGDQIEVFAGCDLTYVTCGSKFDNQINFGGDAYLPRKNPNIGI